MESTVSASTLAKRPRLDRAVYSLAEFASLLGRSYTSCHEAAQRGDLPVDPIRLGRNWLFPKAEVDKLLGIESGRAAENTPPSAA